MRKNKTKLYHLTVLTKTGESYEFDQTLDRNPEEWLFDVIANNAGLIKVSVPTACESFISFDSISRVDFREIDDKEE